MALEGTLKDFSLGDILQLISFQRKTGVLILRSHDETVTLTFHEGAIVFADCSNKLPQNRVGHLLLQSGQLSPEELEKALDVQASSNERLGAILQRMLFCRAEDITQALEVQLKRIVFGLFHWSSGEFVFTAQDGVEYHGDLMRPLGIESVLMESAQMIDEWPIVSQVADSLNVVFKRLAAFEPAGIGASAETEEPLSSLASLASLRSLFDDDQPAMSSNERRVYDLIDGVSTIGQIMDRSLLTEFELYKALHALASRNLIERMTPSPVQHFHSLNMAWEDEETTSRGGIQDAIEAWKTVRSQSGHISSDAAAVAISISKRTAVLAQGVAPAEPWMEVALQTVKDLSKKWSAGRSGALEYVNGEMAVAIVWNTERDYAFVVLDRINGHASKISRFRSHAAKLSACLLAPPADKLIPECPRET